MNQLFDKEGAIERYLNGMMPPTEKKEFMNRLEQDADLRRSVDTELLIRKAIRSDRTDIPAQSAASRTRFLAMLATVAPEPLGVETSQTASQTSATTVTASKGSSMLNLLSGNGLVQGIVAAIAGVAITVGTIVVVSNSSEKGTDGSAGIHPRTIEVAQPLPAATAPQLPGADASAGTPASPVDPQSALHHQKTTAQPLHGTSAAAPMKTMDGTAPPATSRQTTMKAPAGRSSSSTNDEQVPALSSTGEDIKTVPQSRQRNSNETPIVTRDSALMQFNPRNPIIKR